MSSTLGRLALRATRVARTAAPSVLLTVKHVQGI